MAIRKSKDLSGGLGDPSQVTLCKFLGSLVFSRLIAIAQGGTTLHSSRYHLLPADLRLAPSDTLEPMLASSSLIDPSLPTLLLFECVLAYMSPASSAQLLEWFVNFSKRSSNGTLGCIVYEMFGLEDSFGKVMVDNLKVNRTFFFWFPLEFFLTSLQGTWYLLTRCPAISNRRELAGTISSNWILSSPRVDLEGDTTGVH